jgi:hypothetical protein
MQPSFDQLAELAMLGRVIPIDAEQELPIVRLEKGLSAQGSRVWPDIRATSQFIDVRPIELPDVLVGDGQNNARHTALLISPAMDSCGPSNASENRKRPTGPSLSDRSVMPLLLHVSLPLPIQPLWRRGGLRGHEASLGIVHPIWPHPPPRPRYEQRKGRRCKNARGS